MSETPHPTLTSITPFFIVDDVAPSIAFYRDQLGFEVADTQDGLRGFEVQDPDGCVLFFGRPR